MDWSLAPDVHVAAPGGDLVFLDARRGAYTCLAEAAAVVQVDEAGCVQGAEPQLTADLREAGLIVSGLSRARPGGRSSVPPTASLTARSARPDRDQVRRMIGAGLFMLTHFHGRTFAHLIACARRGAFERPPDVVTPQVTTDVAAFRHMLPFVPFQGVCLYRSFMLLHLLRAGGADARWVFGVRTWPFAAHCWLQVGSVVLDDGLDHVAGYSPILTV